MRAFERSLCGFPGCGPGPGKTRWKPPRQHRSAEHGSGAPNRRFRAVPSICVTEFVECTSSFITAHGCNHRSDAGHVLLLVRRVAWRSGLMQASCCGIAQQRATKGDKMICLVHSQTLCCVMIIPNLQFNHRNKYGWYTASLRDTNSIA